MLLYEIFSNGTPPYHNKTTAEVQHHVVNGGKLVMPEGTPDYIKRIADYCWIRNPNERWTMKQVVEKLDHFIKPPRTINTRRQQSRTANSATTSRPNH